MRCVDVVLLSVTELLSVLSALAPVAPITSPLASLGSSQSQKCKMFHLYKINHVRDLKNNSHLLESLQKMKIDQANNAIVIYIVRWEPTQCLKPHIQRAALLLRSLKQRNSKRCRKYLNINIMRIWRSCKCNEILLGGEKLTNLTYS